jgi:hypothetical protein
MTPTDRMLAMMLEKLTSIDKRMATLEGSDLEQRGALNQIMEALETQQGTLNDILAACSGDGGSDIAAALRRLADGQDKLIGRVDVLIAAEIESLPT